uniref:OTU domain-containing protein n=1 Tax=Anopheles melas TaxID=34690 RepID=A0A182UKQ5_9DIPT
MSDNKLPKRGFGFGCRETPDIYDKFLQELGYYRKHTALDTSSLFRVVSEQQHGIQKYHEKVRKDCVMYMRSHKAQFVKDIKWGFEAYMNNMSRMRTHGTLLELKALALLYNANVLLFEPFAEAKWFLHSAANDTVWRVFYGRDNHFDSIYTTEYMISMAECQSIVYDILYTRVLGVPDVQYAVERMLHDPDDTKTTYSEDEEGRQIATTEDGRQLVLSQPHETKCVLIYSHLCHFHNSTSFDAIQRFFAVYGSDEGYRVYIGPHVRRGAKKSNPLLADAKLSCVRQLLDMCITPFPYKVAKALDRNIYRNVEFDVWYEIRTEKWSAFFLEMGNKEEGVKSIQDMKQIIPSGEIMHEGYRRGGERVRFANTQHPLIESTVVKDVTGIVSDQDPSAQHVHPFGVADPHLTLAPYPMPQYYLPSPDQYGGINTVSVMACDQAQIAYGDTNGQQPSPRLGGCVFHPVYPTATTPLVYLQNVTDIIMKQNNVSVTSSTVMIRDPGTLAFPYDTSNPYNSPPPVGGNPYWPNI